MSYASETRVPVAQTRAEIERLVVERHGATQYATGYQTDPPRASVQFHMRDRIIRFDVPLPWKSEPVSERERRGLEQATRSRWRALLLIIKAKLEAVESGVTTFEEEFLAHVVLPGGRTVAQQTLPQIAAAYASGRAPRLLSEFCGGE
jgi:hypothetical protein